MQRSKYLTYSLAVCLLVTLFSLEAGALVFFMATLVAILKNESRNTKIILALLTLAVFMVLLFGLLGLPDSSRQMPPTEAPTPRPSG